MKRYNATWQGQRQVLPPGSGLSTSMPARAASFGSDVLVPACQAVISGCLVAGVATFVLVKAGLQVDALELWAGLALGVACVAWVVLLREHRRLLWAVESAVGADLDKNGTVGKPKERIVLVHGRGRDGDRGGDSDRRSRFGAFVEQLGEKGTDARTWEPIIGRDDYRMFRDSLIRLKLARWKGRGTAHGWELTEAPADVLRRIK